jgi:nicotinamide riboside transporter PnuC
VLGGLRVPLVTVALGSFSVETDAFAFGFVLVAFFAVVFFGAGFTAAFFVDVVFFVCLAMILSPLCLICNYSHLYGRVIKNGV